MMGIVRNTNLINYLSLNPIKISNLKICLIINFKTFIKQILPYRYSGVAPIGILFILFLIISPTFVHYPNN